MVSNQKYMSGTYSSRQVIKVGRMDLEGVDREVGTIKKKAFNEFLTVLIKD